MKDITKNNENTKQLFFLILAIAFSLFGVFAQAVHVTSPYIEVFFSGFSILGAAFLLSWAAEVAQLDVSRSLAIVFIALIVVLPEYAVDVYFSWSAAFKPEYAAYATANMTGANRLLIGFAWPLIVILYWLKTRKNSIDFMQSEKTDVGFLLIASLYAFLIPLKGSLTIFDAVILFFIFGLYLWRVGKTHKEEPHIVGPAKLIGNLEKSKRRLATLFFFIFSATIILISAEPFAEGLVKSGEVLGIDKFLLVQWIAPLASEAPEFIIASIFVLRALPRTGFETLLSSKINQWTLLMGTIPIAYTIAGGSINPFILDLRQNNEILLTAAQSLFAASILMNLRITFKAAFVLFFLFIVQFILPTAHLELSFIYIFLASLLFIRDRKYLIDSLKSLKK